MDDYQCVGFCRVASQCIYQLSYKLQADLLQHILISRMRRYQRCTSEIARRRIW